jgi:hypothetical protein
MTARAEQRVRHRRRVTGRRTVIAGAAASGTTGAAIVTSAMLSPAGAASAWPTAKGSQAAPTTIKGAGTYDGINTGTEPTELGTGPDGRTCEVKTAGITYD